MAVNLSNTVVYIKARFSCIQAAIMLHVVELNSLCVHFIVFLNNYSGFAYSSYSNIYFMIQKLFYDLNIYFMIQ